MGGKEPTILIVDDSRTTRQMVNLALSAQGFRVREAPDGWTAIDFATEQPPDLVLMDLLLPDCDGFDLLRQLRALPGCAAVPILAFSGWMAKMDEARRKHLSFTDYLVKPVEMARLQNVVRSYLTPDGGTPGGGGMSLER